MKQIFYLPIFIAVAVVMAGGCTQRSASTPKTEGTQKAFQQTGTSMQAAASSTSEAADNQVTSTQDIDTSNWKTYRNEELGFEIKYPATWLYKTSSEPRTEMGQGSIDELGRWKNRIGEVYVSGDHVHLTVGVWKASKTIDEMNLELRKDYGNTTTTVNGMSALRWGNPFACDDRVVESNLRCQKQDSMLLQFKDQFYGIDFSLAASEQNDAHRIESEWDAALRSLKIFRIE